MELTITDANFQELIKGDKPLVVDFWAEWCAPCKMITPFVEELAHKYEGKVAIGKLNVDDNDEVVGRFGVRNIPTILFFKNGKLMDKHVGAAPKSALENKIKALL